MGRNPTFYLVLTAADLNSALYQDLHQRQIGMLLWARGDDRLA